MSQAPVSLTEQIQIVLVRPGHSGNIGSTARAMKNMGFTRLTVAAPACEPLAPEAYQMAYGAKDVLEAAQVVETLAEAVGGSHFVVGLTGRSYRRQGHPRFLPEAAQEILDQARQQPVALVFGSEQAGLTIEETVLCHRLVRIPTPGPHPSLNLSQSVMVVLYELVRGIDLPQQPSLPQAAVEDTERLYDVLSQMLSEIGFLNERQGQSLLIRIRRIFSRTGLTIEEVRLWMGIFRELLWHLRHRVIQRGESPHSGSRSDTPEDPG